LVGKRRAIAAAHRELAFAKTEHRLREAFDRAVILLDNVIGVFDLPDRDRCIPFLVQLLQRCLVGAALVHRYLVQHCFLPYGRFCRVKRSGCQHGIDFRF
jgi:hypothetical protein